MQRSEPALDALPSDTSARRAQRGLHVLVFNQHYWPETAATAQVLSDLCEDLAKRRHRVTVLCGQPSYHTTRDQSTPSDEHHRGVDIRRVWSLRPRRRDIPSRLLHYGSYFASSLGEALVRGRPDVCFVMSTPPLLLGVSATVLRALRGVPFVYSVQDLYPDVAVDLGVLPGEGMLTRTIELAANACYRSAAALVTLSPGMEAKLHRKAPAQRIHVIPNWADTAAVEPSPRDNAFAREHGLVDGFVVQYSGNLGMSQGLESVLGAADQLRSRPVKFVLIGEGNARAALEARAHSLQLPNVTFLPPQPRERLSEVLSSCDIGLIPMKHKVAGDLVPSKLYGIMAAGRPILAGVEDSSEVARVVREHDCGWVVPPENAAALASAIEGASRVAAAERTAMGMRGRTACASSYARPALTRRYAEVIESVAARRASRPS